jgi:hypothetical protein
MREFFGITMRRNGSTRGNPCGDIVVAINHIIMGRDPI